MSSRYMKCHCVWGEGSIFCIGVLAMVFSPKTGLHFHNAPLSMQGLLWYTWCLDFLVNQETNSYDPSAVLELTSTVSSFGQLQISATLVLVFFRRIIGLHSLYLFQLSVPVSPFCFWNGCRLFIPW